MKSKLNQVLCLALLFGALLCCTFEPVGLFVLKPRYDWSLLSMVAFIDVCWLWIARTQWQKKSLRGYALLAINLLAAGSIWLGNNPQLVWLVYLAMPFALALQAILLLKPEKEQFLNKDLPRKWAQDMFVGGFGNISGYFRARKQCTQSAKEIDENAKEKTKKAVLTVLAAVACVIPFAAIALVLLSSADAAFDNFMEQIWIVDDIGSVLQVLLWFVVGFFLALSYFFFHSGMKPQEEQKEAAQQNVWYGEYAQRNPLRIPALFVTVFLLVMNVIYTAFSVIQFLYVFSGNTPKDVTLSEYVVSGFWQLIFLTVMNIVLLAAALYFTDKKNAWGQKIMSLLLVVNNAIMGVSAFVRLSNYEEAYGFTLIRLYGYFLLILIGVLLVLCIIKICFNRFPLRNAMFWTILVFAICLLYFPTNRFVAEQNANRYLQDPQKTIDLAYLEELGEAAIPALERLEENAPQASVQQEAQRILASFAKSISGGQGDAFAGEEFTDGY